MHRDPAGAVPLRLLFVTPRYLPFMGGVQNHVYQVSTRLAQAGVDVTVLTTNPGGQLPAEEKLEGVNIRRARAWPANRDYFFAPDIHRIITRGEWDLVHVQSYHTLVAPLAMAAARQAGIPYVLTFHGGGHSSRLRNALRGVQQTMLRPLLKRAERLIAIARFEIAHYSKRLRLSEEQFVLIPNGGDLPQVRNTAADAEDKELLVSIGRLERYKGHQRAIAALPEVLAQRPNVRLWVAGTGPYEPDLRNLASSLGVAENVEIYAIPAVDRERMARELSKAALVVLFSEYETHPIAALEAVALGRPVLVADTSGLSELAQRGLARAIPLNSTPTQVAGAILEQLERPHKPPTIELPTWDDCAADLLSLYGELSGRALCAF